MSYKVSLGSRIGGVLGILALVVAFLIVCALAAALIFGP